MDRAENTQSVLSIQGKDKEPSDVATSGQLPPFREQKDEFEQRADSVKGHLGIQHRRDKNEQQCHKEAGFGRYLYLFGFFDFLLLSQSLLTTISVGHQYITASYQGVFLSDGF